MKREISWSEFCDHVGEVVGISTAGGLPLLDAAEITDLIGRGEIFVSDRLKTLRITLKIEEVLQ